MEKITTKQQRPASELQAGDNIRVSEGEPTRKVLRVEKASDPLGTDCIIVHFEPPSISGMTALPDNRKIYLPGYPCAVFDEPMGWVK